MRLASQLQSRDTVHHPWWWVPLYPAAIVSAFILVSWGHAGLSLFLVLRPLLVAVGCTLGLTLMLAAVFGDRDRAGLVTAAMILMVLSIDDRTAALVAVVVIVLSVEGVWHRGRSFAMARLATRLLTIISAVLMLAVVLDLANAGTWGDVGADLTRPPLPAVGPATSEAPDIYVFLLDGYPGDRAASRATAFDADAFPAALERRGFDVTRDSYSNYLQTPLTLASMLTMRHLVDIPALAPPHGPSARDLRRLRAVLDDAPAFAELRAAGYTVTVVDPGYAHTELRRVDRFIPQPGPAELSLVLLKNTRLHRVIEAVAPGTMNGLARGRIEDAFSAAERIGAETSSGPRLVFVHVPAPHPPWVFEADGRPRNPTNATFAGELDGTVQAGLDAGFAQATYVGDRTISAIDSILGHADRPAAIVVMSDHGPTGGDSTTAPLSSDVETRASNFMAALTPGHPGLIGKRLTPVNLFPVLMDAYLGTTHPRQPDSLWTFHGSSLDGSEAPPVEGWTR